MNTKDWLGLKFGEKVVDIVGTGHVIKNSAEENVIEIQWDDGSVSIFDRNVGNIIGGREPESDKPANRKGKSWSAKNAANPSRPRRCTSTRGTKPSATNATEPK